MKVVALCNKLSRSRLSGKILKAGGGLGGDDLDPSDAELIAMDAAVAPAAAGSPALLNVHAADDPSPRVSNMTTGKHVVVSFRMFPLDIAVLLLPPFLTLECTT